MGRLGELMKKFFLENSNKFIQWVKNGLNAMTYTWYLEYKNIFSDIGVLSLFFAAFLVYPILYPLPFYKGHEIVREVPIAVIDNDKSSLSRQFIRMCDGSENIRVAMHHTSLDEAKKDFYQNKINGILVIPENFSNGIYRNQSANVSVYCDASYFYLYKQVLTGVKYVAAYMSAGIQIQKLQSKGLSQAAAMEARDPVPVISIPLFNPSNSYTDYLIPAILILILQQTLLIGIGFLGGLSYEKQKYHYYAPMINTKGGVISLLFGKAGAYMSLYLLHSIYLFGIIFRFHGLPMKSGIFTLMVFITPFLLSVIFLGISLSTIFRTREMAMLLLLCTSIPFILVSGFSWPVIAMPKWLQWLSMLLPSTFGIDGFMKIAILGGNLQDVSFQWISLWILTFIYFLIATYAMKTIIKKSTKYMEGPL
jgi:ABC-2 type transport system permease protein